jgi:hypothetical protein
VAVAAIEDTIRAWVKAGAALDDEHVFFAKQKVERPSGPYITVLLTGVVPIGTNDAQETNYDALRPAGSEIEIQVIGEREIHASIQAFNCPTTGTNSAVDLMSMMQLRWSLPSVQDVLDAGGISVFDNGEVADLAALLGTNFDGRASIDVRFYARLTVSEFTTWIERVEGTALAVPYSVEAP